MILTDKRLAELRTTAMRQCYSCGGYNEYEPCPTIVNMDGDEILALIDDLASLRADRDEAIGAALAVEQKCYDQAQELAALRKLYDVVSSFVLQDGTLYDCPVYVLHDPLNDTESFMGDMPDIVAAYGAQEMGEALAACDEASAPTET